jgi:hypothetical protein
MTETINEALTSISEGNVNYKNIFVCDDDDYNTKVGMLFTHTNEETGTTEYLIGKETTYFRDQLHTLIKSMLRHNMDHVDDEDIEDTTRYLDYKRKLLGVDRDERHTITSDPVKINIVIDHLNLEDDTRQILKTLHRISKITGVKYSKINDITHLLGVIDLNTKIDTLNAELSGDMIIIKRNIYFSITHCDDDKYTFTLRVKPSRDNMGIVKGSGKHSEPHEIAMKREIEEELCLFEKPDLLSHIEYTNKVQKVIGGKTFVLFKMELNDELFKQFNDHFSELRANEYGEMIEFEFISEPSIPKRLLNNTTKIMLNFNSKLSLHASRRDSISGSELSASDDEPRRSTTYRPRGTHGTRGTRGTRSTRSRGTRRRESWSPADRAVTWRGGSKRKSTKNNKSNKRKSTKNNKKNSNSRKNNRK